MSLTDLAFIGFQIVLPVALLIWLIVAPGKNLLAYLVQVGTITLYLLALHLVPMWLLLPWWTPWIYGAAVVATVTGQVVTGRVVTQPGVPQRWFQWGMVVVLGIAATGLAVLSLGAMAGRAVPDQVVDLTFPMGPGIYLIVNGGSAQTVNGHMMTLNPETDRQRAYRGQSYAVDLIKLGSFGFRAPGWRPDDPAAYAIFGMPVFAPCSGEVLSARGDMSDMPVPDMDTSLLEGNHVFLDCDGMGVLLAHFRQDSVRVSVGDHVETGGQLAEAGNTGQSAEPHLHIHAQQIPADGPLLSGEPMFITVDGEFLIRNDRLEIAGKMTNDR